MNLVRHSAVAVVSAVLLAAAPAAVRAEALQVDPVHSTTVFRIHHFNAGYVWGLIAGPTGTVEYDAADPSRLSLNVSVALANLDTHVERRDNDLKGPDWFNAKQFPTLEFKSKSAKKTGDNAFEVTGDLTIHGVTKSVTVPVEMTGVGKGMRGETRVGFESTFTIKRTDFDMKAMPGGVGEDVRIVVALEAVKQ